MLHKAAEGRPAEHSIASAAPPRIATTLRIDVSPLTARTTVRRPSNPRDGQELCGGFEITAAVVDPVVGDKFCKRLPRALENKDEVMQFQ